MENNTNNVQDVLHLIKGLDVTSSFDVYISSLKRNIKFKQLNTEQFKRLLKTVIDSPIYNTEFITTINNIIKENCLEKDINIANFNILDKLLIVVKTRIESVDSNFTFNFSKEEIEENNLPEPTYSINLAEFYNDFVKNEPVFLPETFNHETISITCSLPTINTENKLEKELHKNIKIEISSPEELRNTLGDAFINEISKYISSLKINENEINLEQISFKDRVKVIEQLPTIIINKTLKYIEKYKKTISVITTHKIPKTEFEKEIPLDATFFNV